VCLFIHFIFNDSAVNDDDDDMYGGKKGDLFMSNHSMMNLMNFEILFENKKFPIQMLLH
jgi:hypothetical protein